MIYKLLVVWGLLIGCLVGAKGQLSTTLAGGSGVSAAVFTGPGDVVASADAWWGLRAYSAADRGNKLVNVCNVSDVACADMSSDATTGKLVVTTVGGSSCSSVTCTIKTFYDRSGANRCSSAACDQTQGTISLRATLLVSCLGSLPCAQCVTGNATNYVTPGTFTTQSQPWSFSAVVNRTGGTGTSSGVIGDTLNSNIMGFFSSANTAFFNAGNANITPTANDNATHAMQAVGNGASGLMYIDGTQTTGNAGVDAIGGAIRLCTNGANTARLTGNLHESGVWGVGFSTGQQSSMNSNQHTFWGF